VAEAIEQGLFLDMVFVDHVRSGLQWRDLLPQFFRLERLSATVTGCGLLVG